MSTLGHDLRHGLGIARVELRRSLRKSFGTRKRQLTVLGFLALFVPVLSFWARVAYTAGRTAAERGEFPVAILGIQLFLIVLVFVVMGALRVVQQGRPEGEALLLTATTPRAVLVGTTVHATVQLVGFVLLPTVLFAGPFALGASRPLVLLTAVLAVVPLFAAVTVLGIVVGQLVVLSLLRSRTLRSASRGFGLLLVLALLALSYTAMAPLVGVAQPLAPLTVVARPATLYLAFAFVGTPFGPDVGVGAVAVLALVVASIPTLFVVADRLAPRLWYADATPAALVQRSESSPRQSTVGGATRLTTRPRAFPPRVGPRPLAVALGLWVRWLRVPVRFSPLFPLLVVLAVGAFGAVGTLERVPLVVGGMLAVAGVYVSGAVFGLNPLGEAGEMRTVEVLSPTPARTLVLGHVLAGLLVGTPAAVAGTAVLAVAAGFSPLVAVGLGALAVVTTVASGGVAVGIGSVLPSDDTRRTYRGYEVTTPSQWALVAYTVAATVLVALAGLGAVLVLVAGDPGTRSSLVVVAVVVVTGVLLGVGYGGARIAVGRFDASPSREAPGESGRPTRRPTGSNGDESSSTLATATFTRAQQVRGLVLLGVFVVLRAVLARAWDQYFPGGYSADPLFLAFLGGTFLLLSVGLVYLGFTRWVGVDLRAWWVDRSRLRGDLLWGVGGVFGVLAVTLGGVLALTTVFPGLAPVGDAGAAPDPTVTGGAESGWAANLLLGWFFGFAIAAFQEETLFRGFLQAVLRERYGRVVAVVGQSAVFTLAHLGYYPVAAWPLLVVVFLVGLVTGWLVDRRGTLLSAGVAHGFVG